MDTLFTNYNQDDSDEETESYYMEENRQIKMDLEELYETKKKSDLIRLGMYNKLLLRIHQRIKTTSRQRINNQICFFVMPEIMIGFPKYDIAEAVFYIMNQLDNNGFKTKYIHPNLIIICWSHWVPSYVRKQLKKKTGIEVNSFGEEIKKEDENFKVSFLKNSSNSSENYDTKFINNNDSFKNKIKQPNDFKVAKQKKEFNSIKKFNPSNNLIYNEDLMNEIENSIHS
tara:strand:- start:933 stop:1616 length:684 start_codon:yes stop_codon:yes gene_type:complete